LKTYALIILRNAYKFSGLRGLAVIQQTLFKHAFFEASSIRKFNGIYYFIYSATNITGLNYCTSLYPDHGFQYRGIIHNTSDIGFSGRSMFNPAYPIGNYHGSVEKIGDKYYVFDHRQTNRSSFSRQSVAEEVQMNPDGSFDQAESTSCGLNGGPLAGKGVYPAYIACNLFPRRIKGVPCSILTPYLTQREMAGKDHPVQYVADIRDGREVGFKYFNFTGNVDRIAVKTAGKASGKLIVSTEENGEAVAEIEVHANRTEPKWKSGIMQRLNGTFGIFIRFKGRGKLDLYTIRFYS
jgi:arabinoxylan arabinofuranohydrolase